MNKINASIVIYHNGIHEVRKIVETLRSSDVVDKIWLIDNSELMTEAMMFLPCDYIFNDANIGFGAGHNIAIRKSIESGCHYHLVINTDIEFDARILREISDYMDEHKEIGALMPKVYYPNGEIQYLCKLLPTPFDLFGRRFLPQRIMKRRMDRFEMRFTSYNEIIDVPYLSGCFMMLRCETLKKTGVFDERFFMYPEDIDISRRIFRESRCVFYPKVSIVHRHNRTSYKNKRLMWIHITNLCKYFNKWGWIFDKERKRINEQTLNQFCKAERKKTKNR